MSAIFDYLDEKEYKATFNLIESSILHTNLATYFQKKIRLNNLLERDALDLNDPEHRDTLIGLTMTTSDLSGQCKEFSVASRLCKKLIMEQNKEASLCTSIKVPFTGSFISKKKSAQTAEFQINFNEQICLPCFNTLSQVLVNIRPIFLGCKKVNGIWQQIARGEIEWHEDDA